MAGHPSIGVIGLGLMGRAFTQRLVECGFAVSGYDIAAERRAAAPSGVRVLDSAAAVTRASDIVLVCVTTSEAVEQAVLGPGGVAEAGDAGKVLVDHGTTTIEVTKRVAGVLAEGCGIAWVDAPVSGGPGAAAAGTLAIMAGGEDTAIARIGPAMAKLASRFTHMGKLGAGQATKMINQVLVLANYCVIAEALRLGERCGVDISRVPQALASGHAGSNLLADVAPRMIARDFTPRGFARQVLKDLDMVHDLGKAVQVATPMAAQAASLYRLLVSRGHGDLDAAAILKLYLDEPL